MCAGIILMMGMSKTEINLRRLLSAAPNQQNQSKLMHVCLSLFSIFKYFVFFCVMKVDDVMYSM